MQAVITADIVNSTLLIPEREQELKEQLDQVLKPYKYEFYRGDSFQVFIKDANLALTLALQCRAAAIGITKEEEKSSDIRISIGIGAVTEAVKILATAKAAPFVLSGRAFDEIAKAEQRLIITTNNQLANAGLEVLSNYADTIFKGMTARQAGVIFELLQGQTQQTVAEKLDKSKSTIHQHASAGRWSEIEKLILQYKNILNHIL